VDARRAAQALIEANDDASADYLKHFYDVDWSDPLLYHLVINTSKLALDQAARLIVEAARQLEGRTEPA
jgi:cytidylate kinase